MANSVRSFTAAVKKSKNLLFVVHEYLPLSFALWLPGVVKSLLAQNKDVTVLVKQEPTGWTQRIDPVYPIDMVVSLDELRQVISIPVSSEDFGQLSYEVADNSLNITLVPGDSPVSFNQMKTLTYGKQYDLVVGIGITAKHGAISLLNNAKSSVSGADYYFLGTISPQSSLSQALPSNPSVEIIEDPDMETLMQIAKELKGNVAEQQINDLFTLFLHTHVRLLGKALSVDTYNFLAELVGNGVNTEKMSKPFSDSAAILNERVQLLLQSMTVSSVGNFAIFGVRKSSLQQYNLAASDLLLATYYLPQYTGIEQCVVVVEEKEYEHQVTAFGQGSGIKQIAIKYGFPFSCEFTGGTVSEVNFDKLCQDITRVMAEEEILPQTKKPQTPTTESTTEEKKVVLTPEAVKQQTPPEEIPVSPSLDEVLQKTTMSAEEVAPVATVTEQKTQPPQTPQVTENVQITNTSAPPPATMPAQTTPQQPKQGLDFAAIAKKMKESIGK